MAEPTEPDEAVLRNMLPHVMDRSIRNAELIAIASGELAQADELLSEWEELDAAASVRSGRRWSGRRRFSSPRLPDGTARFTVLCTVDEADRSLSVQVRPRPGEDIEARFELIDAADQTSTVQTSEAGAVTFHGLPDTPVRLRVTSPPDASDPSSIAQSRFFTV